MSPTGPESSTWVQWRDRLRERLRASRSPSEGQRTYRLANTIRLPIIMGVALFLLVAVAIGALVGRVNEDELQVPQVVLDYQEAVTNEISQSVRRALNEGVADLEQLARTPPPIDDPATVERMLQQVQAVHSRYETIYMLTTEGKVVASAGGTPEPKLLGDDAFTSPGLVQPKQVGDRIVLPQFAPPSKQAPFAIVAHYDVGFLRFSLESAAPGTAWIVDRDGRIMSGGSPFTKLRRQVLRSAAARAATGESGVVRAGGSFSTQEVVAYTPVAGGGPGGELGWSVVTARNVKTASLPQSEARREAVVAGVVVALLGTGLMAWLWLVVIRPTLRLQREAERIAYGDLSKPVEIIRYDEIGLASRALERIRVLLIRRRSQGESSDPS